MSVVLAGLSGEAEGRFLWFPAIKSANHAGDRLFRLRLRAGIMGLLH